MALGGAVALVTSYGIILVERGWAGVIAGTTALAGGIITIALGLILHRLTSLHAVLRSAAAGGPLALESTEDGTVASNAGQLPHYVPKAAMPPEMASAPAGIPSASSVRNWPQRQATRTAHSAGRSIFKPRGTAVPPQPRTWEPGAASPPRPISSPDLAGEPGAAREAGSEADLEPQYAPGDEALGDNPLGRTPGEIRPVQHTGEEEMLTAPQYPEMPTAAGEAKEQALPQTGEPAQSTFIETGLQAAESAASAELAQASSGEADKFLPEAPEETGLQPPSGPSATEAGADLAATHSGEELPSADPFSGAALAIVGRYESEGASFIRYADGSIEARTDHAVFHFKSMDELKRFMESQAQLPKE